MKTIKNSSEEKPTYYGRCPKCGAEIAVTVSLYTGRRLDVDWAPGRDGFMAVRVDGDRLVSRRLRPGERLHLGEHYASAHWATCQAAS